jgi:hypothetical protein
LSPKAARQRQPSENPAPDFPISLTIDKAIPLPRYLSFAQIIAVQRNTLLKLCGLGGFEMEQNGRVSGERHLLRIAADLIRQMTELEKLREAVRLAEAAKALYQSEARRRRRISIRKSSIRLPDRNCALNQRAACRDRNMLPRLRHAETLQVARSPNPNAPVF